jgi:prepilin-type N-terminal cleavage/methylation domain-containing protein
MTREHNTFHNRGFTLPEVMVAVAITIVTALGTLCYQYQGVKHSRIAQAQIIATRLGQLLLEDWKSTGGCPAYDPTILNLGFVTTTCPESDGYRITLDNQSFYMQLTQSDIDQDTVGGVKLRQIRTTIKWRKDYTRGAVVADDPEIVLTTYVRCDLD